jgi:hypothetical protein
MAAREAITAVPIAAASGFIEFFVDIIFSVLNSALNIF